MLLYAKMKEIHDRNEFEVRPCRGVGRACVCYVGSDELMVVSMF